MERFNVLLVCLAALGGRLVRAEFPTQQFIDMIRPAVEKCEEKTGVDKGLVEQFSRGENIADNHDLKCYFKCIFTEFDLVNETSGVFRYEKMINLIPEEMQPIAYNMGRNCVHFKGEEGSDHCQAAFDIHKCWQRTDPEHYFIF